jgi:hypothetical protein
MTESKAIKFQYIFADDYNPTFASGAFGGVTPDGKLVVNYYLERQALPHSQTYELTPEGKLGPEIAGDPVDYRHTLVRFVDMGVVLDAKSAHQLYTWLGGQIDALDKMAAIDGAKEK